MDNNKNINWLNIILNTDFQNAVQVKTLVEISMVSKLVREKLKPIIFKSIEIIARNIKFESNVFSIAIKQVEYYKFRSNFANIVFDGQEILPEFDYQALKEKHKGSIQESYNEYDIALKFIKKFSKHFRLEEAKSAGYYLYPIINGFENLTSLDIVGCNIPFTTFADIGKLLPKVNKLKMSTVNLVKSSTDIIESTDIYYPPKLTNLTIEVIQVVTTDLLMDPYEYLFNTKANNYSYEHFIMPNHPLPFLKRFRYRPSSRIKGFYIRENLGVEEFLDANPKLEILTVSDYNLKMNSSLSSLKYLHVEDYICFNSISNISNLDSIDTLIFCLNKFENTKNFMKLCKLCNNLVELFLYKIGLYTNHQALIDDFLIPALPNLSKLKILKLSYIYNSQFPKIFDFTKFTQIEELELLEFGSISNIKFDSCKSLKRVKFYFQEDSSKYMEELSNYEGWTFKCEGHKIFGKKI
jgi:hypothetical protein